LLPVHVVNLCNSSKMFHCHDDDLLKGTLAKTLMHFSLLQSLDRVLTRSKCGFTVETFRKMTAELEPGSLKISGSAMVQTALGLPFAKKTDVDLYVSMDAAPAVRSWLTGSSSDNCGLIIGGLKNCYPRSRLDTFLNGPGGIEQVEFYAKVPKELHGPTFLGYSKERTAARWRKLKQAKSITYVTPKKSVGRKRTEVRPLQGDTIPFFHVYRTPVDPSSTHLEHSQGRSVPICDFSVVDLVVAKENVSPDFVIDQFDLTICMLSFDGTTFKVPNAQNVFRTNKDTGLHEPSSLLRRNKNELFDFLKGDYFSKDSDMLSTYGRLQAMEWETERFDNAHRFLKFLWNRGYDFGNTNEDRTTIRPPHFVGNSRHDTGADLVWEIHCLVLVAMKRVQKYRKRGIQILNWTPEVNKKVTDMSNYNFPCIHFQSLRR